MLDKGNAENLPFPGSYTTYVVFCVCFILHCPTLYLKKYSRPRDLKSKQDLVGLLARYTAL